MPESKICMLVTKPDWQLQCQMVRYLCRYTPTKYEDTKDAELSDVCA